MRRLALACAILVADTTLVRADARRDISADAMLVASVRPVALLGALARLGSGWEALARRSLPLPPAVSPFDSSLLTTVGIDPAAEAWAAVRTLRGRSHVRVALRLANPRLAEALLQSAARLVGVELARGPQSSWSGHGKNGELVLARLDGDTLVLDVLLGSAPAPPSLAELARLAPLVPPRAWSSSRGAARRVAPEDAAAIWLDLPALVAYALTDAESHIPGKLKAAELSQRTQIVRLARHEIDVCRAAAAKLPATFDDVLVALSVQGPDELQLGLAFGGRRAALEPLRGHDGDAAIRSVHELAELAGDADVRLLVTDPSLVRGLAHFPSVADDPPAGCPDLAADSLRIRGWPALLQRGAAAPLLHLLGGLRGLAASLPASTSDGAGLSARQLLAVAELEPSVRGDLDALLAGKLGAVAPLHAGNQQLSAYAPPRGFFGGGEGPLVVVQPIAGAAGGALLGLGVRDQLRAAIEHLVVGRSEPSTIGTFSANPRGVVRVLSQARDADGQPFTLLDGLQQLDAVITLDAEVLQLQATLGLRAAGQK